MNTNLANVHISVTASESIHIWGTIFHYFTLSTRLLAKYNFLVHRLVQKKQLSGVLAKKSILIQQLQSLQ